MDSSTSSIKIESPKEDTTLKHVKKEKIGKLVDKKVVEAKNQTSKAWFIVAIVIGSLVVLGVGGFGAVGLLQSHGLITLPSSFHWLASAIGTIGNTPHLWSLYAVTAGGVVIGGALIAFGSVKVHKARAQEAKAKKIEAGFKKFETDRKAELEGIKPTMDTSGLDAALTARPSMSSFGDNFAAIGLKSEQYKEFGNGTYSSRHFGHYEGEEKDRKFIPEEREDRHFIVVRTHEGVLMCTKRVTESQKNSLLQLLKVTSAEEYKSA